MDWWTLAFVSVLCLIAGVLLLLMALKNFSSLGP